MKAKLRKSWNWYDESIEKGTEVKIIKGMEADAEGVLNAPYGMCYLCELEGRMYYIPATYITITEWDNTDWEKIRIQASIAAMQGMMAAISPERFTVRISADAVARASVEYADALIEELKKGGNNDKGRGGRTAPADEGEQSDAKRDSF